MSVIKNMMTVAVLLYSSDQDVNQGGSGPSCSALVIWLLYQKC